ncbi:MAG TPA: S8 family serine peptidase [Nitrososphaeraceae archaeon]|jgi:subtilisin family serine protease|nr:S8 family serine peptidase [Nitrososphaeraceae archaeon]
MAEISYTAGNKKINLKPVDDVVVVKYKIPVDNKKALDIISTREESHLERSHVKTYPSFNVSLVTRPIGEVGSTTQKFSDSLSKEENVQFVSPVYKDKDTGSLIVVTDQINVGFKTGVDKQVIDKILAEYDLSIMEQSRFSPQHYILKLNNADNSDKTIEISNNLASKQDIEYADPVTLTEIRKSTVQIPVGKYFSEQWHLNNTGQSSGTPNEDVKALQAWEITEGNPQIVIACLDDGLAYTHIDIINNAWKNPDPGGPDQYGFNYYDNIPSPEPIYFRPPFDEMTGNDIHGTACAGVICAAGEPLSGVCGIARRCKVLGVKIFGGDDLAPPFRVAEAIRYAGHHASILSCSWSSGSPNDTIIQAIREITKSGRNGKGCPVFVATGNDFKTSISFPANIPETIAVGASTNEGKKAPYSNSGPEIDFVAPSSGGTKRIFTTDVPYENRGFNTGKPGQGDPEGLYTSSFGGTSSATPLAAGIGALVLSVNPNFTAEQVRQILQSSSDKIDPTNAHYDTNGFSVTHGYGRLNARRALELAKNKI